MRFIKKLGILPFVTQATTFLNKVRFAPSPTGTFHLGNLRTAWISYLWAQALGFEWVVRFEDIDLARVLPNAQSEQLFEMQALGLVPSYVYTQRSRATRHWQLFERIVREGGAYPCTCTRKDLRQSLDELASAPHSAPPIYNGHCRHQKPSTTRDLPTVAWRFRNENKDGSQDFIIARTMSLDPDHESFTPAYHWACAIDDADGNYALLVRAWDLYSSAAAQRAIQNWLARAEGKSVHHPAIFHTALIVQNDGSRLEKRTKGVTLRELQATGKNTKFILDRFAHSFKTKPADFAAGRLWGEETKSFTLEELGF